MLDKILLWLVLYPIIGGLICLLIPDKMRQVTKAFSFIVTLMSLVVSVLIFVKKPIFFQIGPYTILTADNLSGFIGMFVALFAFLITVYSFGFIERSYGRYFGYVLMTLGSSLGVAFANNLLALLTFWGILAALLYLMVNMSGTDKAASSAKKALIIIGGTDALMMFGIVLIWSSTGTIFMDKVHITLGGWIPYIAFFCLAIASFVKAGVMPFHSWLPDVAEDGPTPVTAYLPASLDKLLGIYLLVRIVLNLFIMNHISNFLLAFFGSATIILAVISALIQHDLKRLLGYHAVSQVGYMVLGLGIGNPIGIAGGLFHMMNNAIYKSCLFLSGGNVEKRTGTTDLSKLGGLAKYMPVTFLSFLIASLSISGIPPFNGFVSKWMIYQGIIESASAKNPLWIVWLSAAMFGSALTIASFMKLIHAVFLGRPESDFSSVKEAGLSMLLPVSLLAVICVIFGVFAFILPIPLFIIPSIGLTLKYIGTWDPLIATILIVIGIVLGVFTYFVLKPAKFRTVKPFVGGEEAASLERISGVDFYNTIRDVKGLSSFYKKEEAKTFDIYDEGSKGIFFLARILQRLHNGILSTYMVWCLIGMLVLFFILMR